MFSKNLKYYRLKRQLSKRALAEKIHVSAMAITHYENGSRKPNMEVLSALADALGVRVSDFLAVRNENLVFEHEEFRKASSLSQMQQEYIRESTEEYLDRFMTAVEVLGGEVLPDAPVLHLLPLSDDPEKNAAALRCHLGFAPDGPIENLIGKLENKGLPVFECPIADSTFSRTTGSVNGRPFIVINPGSSAERERLAVSRELARMMFHWPDSMAEKDIENQATAIGGAFLFPEKDAVRELGVKRSSVTQDMEMVAKEYGISMMLLVVRARRCGILSDSVVRRFHMFASKAGWESSEPTRIEPERPILFEQLVYRAVNEEEISIQRGAELLRRSYADVMTMKKAYEK